LAVDYQAPRQQLPFRRQRINFIWTASTACTERQSKCVDAWINTVNPLHN